MVSSPKRSERYRIGIDCHGTLLDTRSAIRQRAKRRFQRSIPPEKLNREDIVRSGLLTERQYRELADPVFRSSRVLQQVAESDGATEYIIRLIRDGHRVSIVSSSGRDAHRAMLDWLKARELDIPTFALGRGVIKANYVWDFDIVLDDDPEQCVAFRNKGVPFVYLLSHPSNLAFHELGHGIIRVASFREFYDSISQIPDEEEGCVTA